MLKNQAESVIRHAVAGDADAFPAIELSSGEAFRPVPGLEWIADDEVISVGEARRQIETGWAWIAEIEGQGAGFLTAERFGSELHVWQASVLSGMQGRGIGRTLFAQAISEAREGGLTAVTLTTFRDLAWNAPFYAKLGFAIVESEAAGVRLCAILDAEAARGLPAERRCAMRLDL